MTHDTTVPVTGEPPSAERSWPVRAAGPSDAGHIVRLRSELILSEPLAEEWTTWGRDGLARRLAPGGDARAVVVDGPDGTPVCCALAFVHPLLSGPAQPGGTAGRVRAVATRPEFRRRGHARRALSALLERMEAEGVTLFELHAREEASSLFRASGFTTASSMTRMTRPGGAAGPQPGAPSAAAYAETVPKTTGYACVFFTDVEDRPVQLRATYSSSHPWQFPGGTMDHGEQPLQTALRECREETGLVVRGPLRLLASVFSPPGGPWPYSTAGWIFDGGRLTRQEIRSIALDAREHDDVRALALADWKELMPAQDYDRLDAVMTARASGTAAYLTWGWGEP